MIVLDIEDPMLQKICWEKDSGGQTLSTTLLGM